MKTTFVMSLLTLLGLLSPLSGQKETAPVQWIQLFNGRNLDGWTVKITKHAAGENFGRTFRVENGILTVNYDQYQGFDGQFGHLYYNRPFSAYLIAVEYRFVGEKLKDGPGFADRNSGVMLHSQAAASLGFDQDFPISLEMQFLGGDGQEVRPTSNLCTPGTNVVYRGRLSTEHCFESTSKTYHGSRWVRAEALVLGDSLVRHYVEGEPVLAYEKPQIGGTNVANYDPALKIDGQPLRKGYVALQSESQPIEFRKVELIDLSPAMNNPARLRRVLERLRRN